MKPYQYKPKPVPLILGVKDGTRAAKFVSKELSRAGLRRFQFTTENLDADKPSWALALGRQAWETANPAIGERGALWGTQGSALVFPTFHPEYVRRRPSLLPLFRQDLRTFAVFAMIDLYGKPPYQCDV